MDFILLTRVKAVISKGRELGLLRVTINSLSFLKIQSPDYHLDGSHATQGGAHGSGRARVGSFKHGDI